MSDSKSRPLVAVGATVNVSDSWIVVASKAAHDNQALLVSACAVVVAYVVYLTVKVIIDGFKSVVQSLARPLDGKTSN